MICVWIKLPIQNYRLVDIISTLNRSFEHKMTFIKLNAKLSFCSSDEKSDKTFLICSEVLLLFNSMNLKFKYTKETEKLFNRILSIIYFENLTRLNFLSWIRNVNNENRILEELMLIRWDLVYKGKSILTKLFLFVHQFNPIKYPPSLSLKSVIKISKILLFDPSLSLTRLSSN